LVESTMNDAVHNRVKELVERVVQEDGVELVDIQLPRFRSKQLVRIFIDKVGGVSIDDCRRISKKVGDVLDIEDPFPSRYTLEVSSPGVDRPLKTESDFRRNVGRTLRVSISDTENVEGTHTGVLKEIHNDVLLLETDSGRLEIPLKRIGKARVCTAL
jgi:ribosome maturation factor RimP